MTRRPLLAVLFLGCGRASLPVALPSPAEAPAAAALDHALHVANTLLPVVTLEGSPPARRTVAERMAYFRVPGVSVAVADGGRITWARAFGTSTRTLFQAASISKVVTATATLRLVAQGRLSLDEDVNRALTSWHLPDDETTATEKVTLRRILSHTAGLSGPTVCNYGQTPGTPTLPQVLDGAWPHTVPVRVEAVAGSVERYSGGGVTIEQLLLTDVTHRPFAELLDDLVLRPLDMNDSSFAETLPPDFQSRAALGHDSAGAPLPPSRCPEVGAAGLWTTPSDLLKWAIAVARARDGASDGFLPSALAIEMLTAQKAGGHFGLGPTLEGSGPAFHYGHGGWNAGYHAEVIYFPARGQGAAVMLNGDGGRPMVREILYAIAAEYGWPSFAPPAVPALSVDEATLDRVAGTYESKLPAATATLSREGTRLFLDAPVLGARTEVVFTSKTKIVSLDTGDELSLVTSGDGRIAALQLGFVTMTRRPP